MHTLAIQNPYSTPNYNAVTYNTKRPPKRTPLGNIEPNVQNQKRSRDVDVEGLRAEDLRDVSRLRSGPKVKLLEQRTFRSFEKPYERNPYFITREKKLNIIGFLTFAMVLIIPGERV